MERIFLRFTISVGPPSTLGSAHLRSCRMLKVREHSVSLRTSTQATSPQQSYQSSGNIAGCRFRDCGELHQANGEARLCWAGCRKIAKQKLLLRTCSVYTNPRSISRNRARICPRLRGHYLVQPAEQLQRHTGQQLH